ncbi:hypothetical protein AB4Y32_08395 [Paraburkholderia phymatum]|uniref:Uncharacterized protein n=1 Tax=Paraburkholderia phymatum TaxID=148447 RepID=A0ACC6TWI5_9BURK
MSYRSGEDAGSIAVVPTYVHSAWRNDAQPITASGVSALREIPRK